MTPFLRDKSYDLCVIHCYLILNTNFTGSSIHDAAKNGDIDRIKELINVVPEMKNKMNERGMNPLHIAAANGRLDCVKWLAVSGVDLAEETPTGYTAMHLAAMNGHVNCMMVSCKGTRFIDSD